MIEAFPQALETPHELRKLVRAVRGKEVDYRPPGLRRQGLLVLAQRAAVRHEALALPDLAAPAAGALDEVLGQRHFRGRERGDRAHQGHLDLRRWAVGLGEVVVPDHGGERAARWLHAALPGRGAERPGKALARIRVARAEALREVR